MNIQILFWSVLGPLIILLVSLWSQADGTIQLCSQDANARPCLTDDSQLLYALPVDVPNSEVYAYQQKKLTAWALGPFVAFARHLIVKYNDLDFGVITGYVTNPQTIVVPDIIYEILPMELALVVGLVIGLLTAIFLPVIGFCVCCCRCCCKNCGGQINLNQARNQTMKGCVIVAVFIIVSCMMMAVGGGAVYTVGERLPEAMEFTSNSINYSVSDIQTFKDHLIDQLRDILNKDANFTLEAIHYKLDVMPDEIMKPFIIEVKPTTDLVVASLTSLEVGLNASKDSFSGIQTSVTGMTNAFTALDTAMSNIGDKLDAANALCLSTPGATCGSTPTRPVLPTFPTMPDMTGIQNSLDDADNLPLATVKNTVVTVFDGLPNMVSVSAADIVTDTKSQLNLFDPSSFLPTIDRLDEQLDAMMTLLQGAVVLLNSNFFGSINEFAPIIGYAFMGLSSLIILVLLPLLLGCLIGSLTYKSQPENRSGFGTCSHCCLSLATVTSVFVGMFYMLLGSIFFFFCGNLTLVCQGLTDFRLVEEASDVFLGNTLSSLLGNSSVNLNAADILQSCKKDETLFNVFDLASTFNITGMLDIQSLISPELFDQISGIVNSTLDDIELLDNSTKSSIAAVMTDSASYPDFGNLKNQLTDALDDLSVIQVLKNAIDAVVTSLEVVPGAATLKAKYQEISDDIAAVQAGELLELQSQVANLMGYLTTMPGNLMDIVSSLSDILTHVDTLSAYIEGPGPGTLFNSVLGFVHSVIGMAEQVIEHTTHTLNTDLGKCSMVYYVYMGVINVLCYFGLDILNGFWLGLCVCGFFCAISFVTSLVFINYVRRLTSGAVSTLPTQQGVHHGTTNSGQIEL